MQSCIWSFCSWSLNPCDAVLHANLLPLATGAETAELAVTAGVVVDCAKAAIAIKSEPVATMVLNKILMAGSN